VRLAHVITGGAAAALLLTGCGGSGPVTYVSPGSNVSYVYLLQWVRGSHGKVSGTVTDTAIGGAKLHAFHVTTGRYGFTGLVSDKAVMLTFRRYSEFPGLVAYGSFTGGTLKLGPLPQLFDSSGTGIFRQADATAYTAAVAKLKRLAGRLNACTSRSCVEHLLLDG
jgi:hypothetical protein